MDHSTNIAPVPVTQAVDCELINRTGTAQPITAKLLYDPRDAYAVTAVFVTDGRQVQWTFARDLLIEGVHQPAGDGDVRCWPAVDPAGRAVVIIELCSPDGCALLQARTVELTPFVERIKEVVLPGAESDYVDVDATIAAILGSTSL